MSTPSSAPEKTGDAQTIADLAVGAARARLLHGDVVGLTPCVLVDSEKAKVLSLEPMMAHRARLRGQFETGDLDAFVDYITVRKADAGVPMERVMVAIDAAEMRARAIFNVGTAQAPGHADDAASLTLQPTPAYQAILKVNGARLTQKGLADWLDDWCGYLLPFYDDAPPQAVTPASVPILSVDATTRNAIRAVRNITVRKASEANNEIGNLKARVSTLSTIDARSDAQKLPSGFVAYTQLYDWLPLMELRLALSLSTDETPTLALRIVQLAEAQRLATEHFKDWLMQRLSDAFIVIGSYDAGV